MPERFSARELLSERMDDPRLESKEEALALKGLDTLGRGAGFDRQVFKGLLALLKETGRRSFKLVELGAGSGRLSRSLRMLLAREGFKVELLATDLKASKGVKRLDALKSAQLPPADFYFSSLLLHHLEDAQIMRLFKILSTKAKLGFLHLDLERGFLAHALTWALLRLWPGMPGIVRHDGPVSVRRAFSASELEQALVRAGLKARVRRLFPFRLQLSWLRSA